MNAWLATTLAAVTGWFTGYWVAKIAYPSPGKRLLYGLTILGSIGALVMMAIFVFMDVVLRFGDNPSFGFALVATIGMEGVALLGAWIGTWLQKSIRWPKNADELIDSDAAASPAQVWTFGVVVPAVFIYFGVSTAIQGKATVGSTLWHNEVSGFAAVSYGAAAIAIGMFMHFHFFWSAQPALQPYSRAGKQLSLVIGCLGLMYAAISGIG